MIRGPGCVTLGGAWRGGDIHYVTAGHDCHDPPCHPDHHQCQWPQDQHHDASQRLNRARQFLTNSPVFLVWLIPPHSHSSRQSATNFHMVPPGWTAGVSPVCPEVSAAASFEEPPRPLQLQCSLLWPVELLGLAMATETMSVATWDHNISVKWRTLKLLIIHTNPKLFEILKNDFYLISLYPSG